MSGILKEFGYCCLITPLELGLVNGIVHVEREKFMN